MSKTELVCDLGNNFGANCSLNPNWISAQLGLGLQLGLAAFAAPLHLHVSI
jgi:hypothetical protein